MTDFLVRLLILFLPQIPRTPLYKTSKQIPHTRKKACCVTVQATSFPGFLDQPPSWLVRCFPHFSVADFGVFAVVMVFGLIVVLLFMFDFVSIAIIIFIFNSALQIMNERSNIRSETR